MSVRSSVAWLRGFARDRVGATALEFALVSPVLLTLLLGGLQLGWALHCGSSVRWALESSARSLLLDPNTTASQLRAAMVAKLSGLADASSLQVQLTTDRSNPAAPVARASSVYTPTLAVAFLPVYQLRFQATAVVPLT